MKIPKIIFALMGLFNTQIGIAQNCDNFSDTTNWPTTSYLTEFEGIIGYTQDDTQPITIDLETFCWVNNYDPGIYLVGTANFPFDNTSQEARFEIYGFYGQYNQMGFAVNGSDAHYMDEDFPMIIDGVTIDLDTTATDFASWENAYLTFTGTLETIDIIGFESGVTTLCVTSDSSVVIDNECDDFSLTENWETGIFNTPGEVLGYTQNGTQAVTLGDTASAYINDSFVGLFLFGPTYFDFDGTIQEARFNVYGFYEQYGEMGFAVNGSDIHYMNEDFPMTIGDVTIDLDTTATNLSFWTNAYLTFTGALETVTMIGFESGVSELCVNTNEEGASIEKTVFNSLNIYPNPTHGNTIFQSTSPIKNIQIYSLSGELILTKSLLNDQKISADLSEISSGIYIVSIETISGENMIRKLIKE